MMSSSSFSETAFIAVLSKNMSLLSTKIGNYKEAIKALNEVVTMSSLISATANDPLGFVASWNAVREIPGFFSELLAGPKTGPEMKINLNSCINHIEKVVLPWHEEKVRAAQEILARPL